MNWALLKNSLLLPTGVTVLATSLGFLAGLCAVCLGRRWRYTVVLCAVIALLLPPFLVTNCWLHYLGANGVWRPFVPLNIFSMAGAIGILSLLYWPIPMLACLAAWRRVESTHLEADPALQGAWLIRLLLWPIARPLLALASLIVFVLALNNFAVPTILQTRVLAANIWISYNTNLDAAAAFFESVPLILASFAFLLIAASTGISWPFREKLAEATAFRRQIGMTWFGVVTAATIALLALSVVLPFGHLISAAETWKQLPLVLRAASGVITNSAVYAALTATACLLLGFALWRVRIASWLWIAFLVPGMFVALLLILTFNRPGLGIVYGTGVMVVLACTIRYCALAWSSLRRAMQSVDTELTDAARLEGARGWQLFRHVHWPQVALYAGFAWYVVYVLCLWDVETLMLVLPPGGETLAARIFNMLHYGHTGQVNSLCMVLLALALAPLWLIGQLRPKASRSVKL